MLALGLGGCAPTGVVEEAPPPEEVVDVPAIPPQEYEDISHPLPPPDCWQSYPPPQGEQHRPFVWESDRSTDDDHPCRYGCKATVDAPTSTAPGIVVAIVDDGGVRITTSKWEVRLEAEGIAAKHVQWLSWCGPEIGLAIHDRKDLRMVAIDGATGKIVERIEQPIDPVAGEDPDFALQMHCWDLHTAVHARGRAGAWSMSLPTHRIPIRRVPDDVWADIVARPWGSEHEPNDPVERSTSTRRFYRRENQLFGFDLEGVPLWHRTSVDAWVGCLYGGPNVIGCSRCGLPSYALRLVGEHAFLEHHYVRSSTDVFDGDGEHIVHLAY